VIITPIITLGPGWGTGSHETTQLCLQALRHFGRSTSRALDFGSGSGILSIALAQLGAEVDAVEIDPEANLHAARNARANGVEGRIRFMETLRPADPRSRYPMIVANILKPVLLDFADALIERLAPGGILILSGLVSTDIPGMIVRYSSIGPIQPQVFSLGEWRAVVWRP
jgi:ribosomal protein L11 methyltransferase